MSSRASVTTWIRELKEGEEAALQELVSRYRPLLLNLARRRLKGLAPRAVDEEDVAQEAFLGFYQSVKAGRTPRLENRKDLWALLATITARKAATQIERQMAEKRGGGTTRGESALDALAGISHNGHGIDMAVDHCPTPEEEAVLKDSLDHYLASLPDDLRPFAELHLAGCVHEEIAQELNCALRTVERKMARIFESWRELAADSVLRET